MLMQLRFDTVHTALSYTFWCNGVTRVYVENFKQNATPMLFISHYPALWRFNGMATNKWSLYRYVISAFVCIHACAWFRTNRNKLIDANISVIYLSTVTLAIALPALLLLQDRSNWRQWRHFLMSNGPVLSSRVCLGWDWLEPEASCRHAGCFWRSSGIRRSLSDSDCGMRSASVSEIYNSSL